MIFIAGAFVPAIGSQSQNQESPNADTGVPTSTNLIGNIQSSEPLNSSNSVQVKKNSDTPQPLSGDLWWNTAWLCRKKITIDHTKVVASLTNFPVLISLSSDANLAAYTQTNGYDLVFTNKTGTKLYHEIEQFDHATGKLICWVNVTFLSSLTDTILYMYYNNPTCGNQQSRNNVWDANFKLVYHMNGTSSKQIDSTVNNHYGTPSTTTPGATGIIDGAYAFSGGSGTIAVASYADISPPWTAEFWVKKVNSPSGIATFSDTSGVSSLRLEQYSGSGHVGFTKYGAADYVFTTYIAPTTCWVHIVYVGNSSNTKLYVNGTLQETNSNAINCPMNYIGRSAGYTACGTLDEIRMSNIYRNTSWLKAEYNNHLNPSGFYSLGSQEGGALPTTPVLSNENPTNNSYNNNINPRLSIQASDYQGDAMNIYFKTNLSGTWQTIGTNLTVYNGTYYCPNTAQMNSYLTKYWWAVCAKPLASNTWTNKTYSFTTKKTSITQPFAQGWLYRKTITIDHTKVAGTLAGFPVLINLTSDADLAAHALANGNDIVFMDSYGVAHQLPHEIEYFDHATGRLVAWVNVSSLSSTSDTMIYMYYGNSNILWGNCQDVAHVWDSKFSGVWHLNETGSNVFDSSIYNNAGS